MQVKRRSLSWKKPLRKALQNKSGLEEIKKRAHKVAVSEIERGVKFCIENGLKIVGPALNKYFDMSHRCQCLLARNSGDFDYYTEKHRLRLSDDQAGRLGFIKSLDWEYAISEPDYYVSWVLVYNLLWRRVGQFFKENPQYGVK